MPIIEGRIWRHCLTSQWLYEVSVIFNLWMRRPQMLNDMPEVPQLVRVNASQPLKPRLLAPTLAARLPPSDTCEGRSHESVTAAWTVVRAEGITLVLFIFFKMSTIPQRVLS